MKLIVLAEDFYPNVSGGAHARFRFCTLAVDRGYDVTVITPLRDETPRRETVNGVDIVRPFRAKPPTLPAYSTFGVVTRTIYSILLFGYLLWWIRGREFDGIHSVSHSMHWVAKLVSIISDVPLITFMGYTPSANAEFIPRPKFLRERLNFRLFMGGTVFCRSERVARVVRAASGSDVSVLHGILHDERIKRAADETDPETVRSRFDVGPDRKLLVYVGRLVPIKNPEGVLDVVTSLPDEYVLLVIGTGPLAPELRTSVNERGLDHRVRFAGELRHEETLRCIAVSDGLILPSHEEAYPTTVFEALALGRHVFATPVGVLPEVDHERLHLGKVSEFTALVTTTRMKGAPDLDEVTLERYSMDRYTERILRAFEASVADDSETSTE